MEREPFNDAIPEENGNPKPVDFCLDPHHNDLCEGGVTVAEFPTEEECNFAVYLLAERGIQSGVLLPDRRCDLRPPQVRVSPGDAAVGREILAQPITAAKRAEYDAQPECEPFAIPCCPRCASSEVVLESVADGNSWRCETCVGVGLRPRTLRTLHKRLPSCCQRLFCRAFKSNQPASPVSTSGYAYQVPARRCAGRLLFAYIARSPDGQLQHQPLRSH